MGAILTRTATYAHRQEMCCRHTESCGAQWLSGIHFLNESDLCTQYKQGGETRVRDKAFVGAILTDSNLS
jgi:hypothetical protein